MELRSGTREAITQKSKRRVIMGAIAAAVLLLAMGVGSNASATT